MQANVSEVGLDQNLAGAAAPVPKPAKPRVLFLINSLEGGGAERVMCTLLRHSEAQRQEFAMSLGLLDNVARVNAPPDWIEIHQLNCAKSGIRSFTGVRGLLRKLKPDVTVSFLTRANLANVLNARCPAIISERANTTAHFARGPLGFVARMTVRAAYPRAARIIAVSEGVARDLTDNYRVAADRIVTISNPVDVETINAEALTAPAFDVGAPYVFAAGRLAKSKNFALLIRAFAASGLDGKVVIAGEGQERSELVQIARECGVADRVLLPGFVANPYAFMRRARAFVLSSNVEGFPNALVEAMAAGTAVVAANCASGPSEILAARPRESIAGLTFAEHGILTPPGDVAAMAEALRSLADESRRASYAEKAKARAGDFSVAVAARQYWDVVRKVLAGA